MQPLQAVLVGAAGVMPQMVMSDYGSMPYSYVHPHDVGMKSHSMGGYAGMMPSYQVGQ